MTMLKNRLTVWGADEAYFKVLNKYTRKMDRLFIKDLYGDPSHEFHKKLSEQEIDLEDNLIFSLLSVKSSILLGKELTNYGAEEICHYVKDALINRYFNQWQNREFLASMFFSLPVSDDMKAIIRLVL